MKPITLAGCLILDDYDRMLLLHRNTPTHSHWELPGGKIETGETEEVAAVREAQEELGIQVRLTKALGSGEFEDQDRNYRFYWFGAVVLDGEPNIREPQTFDDLDYFELEDLLSLSLSPNMTVLLEKISSGEIIISD